MDIDENAHVVHDVLTAHIQDLSRSITQLKFRASDAQEELDALNERIERLESEEKAVSEHRKTLEVSDG